MKKCIELPFLRDTQITPSENKISLVFAKHLKNMEDFGLKKSS